MIHGILISLLLFLVFFCMHKYIGMKYLPRVISYWDILQSWNIKVSYLRWSLVNLIRKSEKCSEREGTFSQGACPEFTWVNLCGFALEQLIWIEEYLGTIKSRETSCLHREIWRHSLVSLDVYRWVIIKVVALH